VIRAVLQGFSVLLRPAFAALRDLILLRPAFAALRDLILLRTAFAVLRAGF